MTVDVLCASLECARCGERIGAYEPLWLQRPDGRFLATGLTRITEQVREGGRLFHRGCAAPTSESHVADQSADREARVVAGRATPELRAVADADSEAHRLVEGAFSQAAVGIGVVGLDGGWLQVNRALCEITGFAEAELQERTIGELTYAPDRDADRTQRRRLLRGELDAYRIDTRLTGRTGDWVWVQLSVTAVRDRAGRPAHLVVVVEDVSRRKQLEQARERERIALAEAQRIARIGSWWWDRATDEARWSGQMYRIFGRRPELGAATGEPFLASVHEEDRDRVASAYAEAMRGGALLELEYRIVRPDGAVRTLWARGCRDSARPEVFVGTVQDVSELRAAVVQARRDRDVAAAITRSMPEGVVITRNRVIVDVNPALCELTGFARHELLGASAPYPFWTPETAAKLRHQWPFVGERGRVEVQATLVRKDGATLDALISAVVARAADGELLGYVCTIRDISNQKRYQAELQRLATHDPLTGLANHRTFHEHLGREVSRANRHRLSLSVAVLDLDRFKRINDTFGHPVGDRVLCETAERLRSLVREGELLARVGGEEFAWILTDADREGAVLAAERARRAISADPFPQAGTLTMSAGVCELAPAGDARQLYALADQALYRAKQRGRDQTRSYAPDELASGRGS